jgi:integrase
VASICNEKNGNKRIALVDHEGRHRSLRLGKCSMKVAETMRIRIEQLLQDRRFGAPHAPATAEWLAKLPTDLHGRLVKLGLTESRIKAVTVGELIDRFMKAQHVKPATLAAYKQCTDSLIKALGKDTSVDTITAADADAWRCFIAKEGRVREKKGPRSLAAATVAKRTNIAKAIFAKAKVWKLVTESPFAHMKSGSQVNPDRAWYITLQETSSLLKACPSTEWQVIVALARYAGLRCPSEVRELRWSDVDWDRKLLVVRTPKTAGKAAHAVRKVPVSPALQPLLSKLRRETSADAEHLVSVVQPASYNLRTRFERIVRRAGLQPWPRLFHNLRASCSTDFAQSLPNHEAARFLGHSPLIAAAHYLQPSGHNFRAVAGEGPWISKSNGDDTSTIERGD